MVMKCSECGGNVSKVSQGVLKCVKCGREKRIEEKVIETVDMSDTANLDVIME